MMKYQLILCGIFLLYILEVEGQEKWISNSTDNNKLITQEIQRYKNLLQPNHSSSVASAWFDVTFYKLDLSIETVPPHLIGVVTIKGICREQASTILTFDLMNSMYVDSIKIDSATYPFTQRQAAIDINLGVITSTNTTLVIEIFYQGIPNDTGLGSFVFSSHSNLPWIWSLSEPYGARDWWPCKDHPSDKADSADIIITCDSIFKVGSNGKLISVINNGDGTKTHHWQERYPIASYLISLAITNFKEFSNWFHFSSTDSMEILNYVLPENLSTAMVELPRTVDMLQIFSELFGSYPFIKEKYGHADFGRGGAMEHQTMTSTTTYNENTVAHELAHQWFGNMITCRTWQDLWLNEGFAQYSTALYLEKKYGNTAYWKYMKEQMSNALFAIGSVYVQDTSSVRNLFDGTRVYSKGASVLHMLRHVLGDSIFFLSLYSYANDPRIKYGTASTTDFQSICESISGKNLNYFFNQWIYGENYPHYSFQWRNQSSAGNHNISIEIRQKINESNPSIFTMPLDIKLISEGWDTTITVLNDAQKQFFTVAIMQPITAVQLDPEEWVLKSVFENFSSSLMLRQNYPNPFKLTTRIDYQIQKRDRIKLHIYNILGQKVETLVDEIKSMGDYKVYWNPVNYPAGVYIYQLQTSDKRENRKMIFMGW